MILAILVTLTPCFLGVLRFFCDFQSSPFVQFYITLLPLRWLWWFSPSYVFACRFISRLANFNFSWGGVYTPDQFSTFRLFQAFRLFQLFNFLKFPSFSTFTAFSTFSTFSTFHLFRLFFKYPITPVRSDFTYPAYFPSFLFVPIL